MLCGGWSQWGRHASVWHSLPVQSEQLPTPNLPSTFSSRRKSVPPFPAKAVIASKVRKLWPCALLAWTFVRWAPRVFQGLECCPSAELQAFLLLPGQSRSADESVWS